MSFLNIMEAVKGIKGDDTVNISAFNVEYHAINPEDVSITSVKDKINIKTKDTQDDSDDSEIESDVQSDVKKEGGYHLREFVHDLGKIIGLKQNGVIRITFSLKSIPDDITYGIEIEYSHLRRKNKEGKYLRGVEKVRIGADNKNRIIDVSQNGLDAIIDDSETARHANDVVERLGVPESTRFPTSNYIMLMKIIFVQLKRIVNTFNFKKDEDEHEQRG